MSCLTVVYFSSTGVRLDMANGLLLSATRTDATQTTARAASAAHAESPGPPAVPGTYPPMQALTQACLLFQEARQPRLVSPALRLGDLAEQLPQALLAPAADQFVEGLREGGCVRG